MEEEVVELVALGRGEGAEEVGLGGGDGVVGAGEQVEPPGGITVTM